MRSFRRAVLAGGALAATALLANPAFAATPSSSEIGGGRPTVTWTGRTTLPAGGVYCLSSTDPVCDNFFLDATSTGNVTVTVNAPAGDDWDIVVYDADGAVLGTSSEQGTANDKVTFPVVAGGEYEVDIAPFLVLSGGSYSGKAVFTP